MCSLRVRNNLFHISGTDIVRCLSFRFQAFGRPVKNSKKFEEGIFSDLRNLKSGTDASLEEPKSKFLDFLYKNNCIRTQKKQKVFYWYSVPHDRLFLDALERDLKREKMGQEPTTVAVSEPALSFEFDSSQSLFEQLTKAQQTNSSSFSNNVQSFAQSTSPQMRADSMPAPAVMPQQMPQPVMEDPLNPAVNPYMQQMPTSMPGVSNAVISKTREREFGQVQFERGPFASYAELSAFFNRRAKMAYDYYRLPEDHPWRKERFDDSEALVLTHQDINPRNIIVGEDNRIWMIDFGWAGYYPPWFEYVAMMRQEEHEQDVGNHYPYFESLIPFICGSYFEQEYWLDNMSWGFYYK